MDSGNLTSGGLDLSWLLKLPFLAPTYPVDQNIFFTHQMRVNFQTYSQSELDRAMIEDIAGSVGDSKS